MRRLRTALSTAVLGAAIVSVTATSIGVAALRTGAGAGGSGTGSHGSTSFVAEHRYIDTLRPIAEQVREGVAPVQKALNVVLAPHFGDDYAARDAIVHGGALVVLKAADRSLHHLVAPADLRRRHATLQHALDRMVSHLRALASVGNTTNTFTIENRLDGDDGTAFVDAATTWMTAVQAVAADAHASAPAAVDPDHLHRLPATLGTWILGADRVCSSGFRHLAPMLLNKPKTLAGAERYESLFASVAHQQATGLRQLILPASRPGADLRRDILPRLAALSQDGRVALRLSHDMRRGDPAAVQVDFARASELDAALHGLGRAMQRHGAVMCGLVFGGSKSKSSTSTSSGQLAT